MADPLIQIVDEHDRPTGGATKSETWGKGLIHRIVFIMVEDQTGKILLQKRSLRMGLWPGCWTVSASGHVDVGEDYDTAAARELAEEIGVTGVELTDLGSFFYDGKFENKRLRRFNKAYKVMIPGDSGLSLQADEVTETRWFTLSQVRDLIEHPKNVTPMLAKIIKDYYPG